MKNSKSTCFKKIRDSAIILSYDKKIFQSCLDTLQGAKIVNHGVDHITLYALSYWITLFQDLLHTIKCTPEISDTLKQEIDNHFTTIKDIRDKLCHRLIKEVKKKNLSKERKDIREIFRIFDIVTESLEDELQEEISSKFVIGLQNPIWTGEIIAKSILDKNL